MKRTITAIALMAASIACAVPAPYPVTVNSRAQTAPPVVAYAGNETVYRVSFTDGDTASAIGAGEVPFFAWATNNAASVNSTSTYAIVAGATGVVDFTFSPAAVNFAPGRYIYETGVRGSNGNTRVYRQGTFQIYGSPVGSGVAAVNWTTNMNWAAINWQNLPTWLSTPAVTPAQTSGWVTASHDGFITTNDADRIVFNALSTNRVTRWYDPELPTRWAEWDGGTNIVIYRSMVTGTNYIVTLSEDFLSSDEQRPFWSTNAWPFSEEEWVGQEAYDSELDLWSFNIQGGLSSWNAASEGAVVVYPITLTAGGWAFGTATISQHFTYTNSVEWRYYLPTNAIPPELANLDNLQGWLNNLYAMKSVVDGHITNGTHTNVTLAGTVTIGGVTRTDWPSGTPGEITVDQVSGAYPSSNPSNYVTSAVATNISQSLISATCSQTCIRAWMPLTTHSQYGYVDLPAASNSTVALGPAPLNSFVVRVSVLEAYSAAQYTFSNIVLYAGSHTTPPESQGFTACTTGVFTASNWNLLSPTGYLMRRDDSKMIYGASRRDIVAYSLGMSGKVRLICWWSPATPAELAAGTNVFYYGSDAQ